MILVGAAGFLGSRLRVHLEGTATILPVARRPLRGDEMVVDLCSDACLDALVAIATGQIVIYCANVGGRAEAERNPQAAWLVNAVAPARLAAVASYFVYFSTDYVFSRSGHFRSSDVPKAVGHYAATKLAGERAVLREAESHLVIRVSGLYDIDGSRGMRFEDLTHVDGADDQASNPTFVPDLGKELLALIEARTCGVRHSIGPQEMSRYEFLQMASGRWDFDVCPVTSGRSQHDRHLASDTATIRSPGEVFWKPRCDETGISEHTPPTSPTYDHATVCVVDCVGVLLGARRWKHDRDFWLTQDSLESRRSSDLDDSFVSATSRAYTLNPLVWHRMRHLPKQTRLVLANNGPWATFSTWVERFSLERHFDLIINSERDSIRKPSTAFFDRVEKHFDAHPSDCFIADDRVDVVDAASARGWAGTVAVRRGGGPVDAYEVERLGVALHDRTDQG